MLFDFISSSTGDEEEYYLAKGYKCKNMDLDLGFVFTIFSILLISFFKYRFAGYIKVVRIEYSIYNYRGICYIK